MRKHELLTEAEREQLLGIPTERDDLARLYTFERGDLDLIRLRREDRNRLGVALQLALVRHPGMTLAQILQSSAGLPEELVFFIAEQLDIQAASFADYAGREQTMSDHARELAAAYGLRGAIRRDIPIMIEAAAEAAWDTDKGIVIAARIIDALRQANILLPAISTIERAGIAGRARARKQSAHALVAGLRPVQLDALDALMIPEAGKGTMPLTWLKTIPTAAKPDHVRDILERLRMVREIGIPAKLTAAVHPDRYRQFVREGRASPAYLLERYTASRRRATLVACLIDLEERLTDAAIGLADKLIGNAFSRAQNKQTRRYAATAKDVGRLMRLFRGTIDALSTALDNDSDPIEAIDETVGWTNLLKARPEVAALAENADIDPLMVAVDRYATLRKFAPALIEALDFKAGRGSARTIAGIHLLRDLNRSGKRDVPPDAPMPFKKEWHKLVIGPDGRINRRLYETAMLAHLRNKLRSGDVWVERSSAYRRFDSYLLPERAAAPIVADLGLPTAADEWLQQRGRELDWRLKKFAQRLKRDQLEGVRFVEDRLQISSVKTAVPSEAEALADQLDALMPRIRITELLHEVARETGFMAAFTNLRTGECCPNESALLAAILADATNLGLSRMAAASQGVTRDQLIWTQDAYVREDTYRAALATIINAQHHLPIARIWGDGTTSSSDGQFFRGAKRGASGGDINARYGVDPSFSFYTHVSDQHGPYHVKVISATTHEAPYVLDGLLHHGSNLSIMEHYTDTGGATDHVFALCAMLGFRFCPRLRDFPDRRLIPIDHPASYQTITPLLGKRIRADVIREHWDDVMRLVASLKAGHVAPSVMLRKLAAYERQNQMDIALQEIGKVERTLFMLDWLENPALRRRCHAGLNKGEQRHALAQAIYTFRQGRVIDRSHEAQQYRASGLNLVTAAIVHWNSVYITDAVAHLRSEGKIVPDDLLAHTSPVGWEHIAFSGDFLWDRAATATGRKPLNLTGKQRAA
ncbi:tn3 transposase DDE domain protein [Sinorhizobium sp. KGO-5]|uniref:Tn3 family transposase n=1 Tax=Sinorhizobium sp. KGO-5 TaxID=1470810 RepID=UPI002949C992|nr:tn3 transposase DDE domain protein [Sinorhizobium sp. KGO-5]